MNIPLTNYQVADKLNTHISNIIPYSDLKNYKNISQLLPNNDSFKILLLEEKENRGHFVAIFKNNNQYCYFNSYGKKYDTDLNVISDFARRILGQDKQEIRRLLNGKNMIYNKYCFQNDTSETCGRFCIWIIRKCCYDNIPYSKVLDILKRDGSPNYDKYILTQTA
jgi:hypothetical protein